MKKTVLTFGLLSGAVSAIMMVATVPFMHKIGFDKGLYVGYTAIVLSFLLVFFGIRSYRENVGGGSISFGRAFAVGILITLISSLCYVITWEILYYNFLPDFWSTWTNYAVDNLRASGASQAIIDAKIQEMKAMKVMMDNPLLNGAMVFIEPFPVGLLITLISAAILRKRRKDSNAGLPIPAAAD
jgi:Protein of unknown function (DUF4199)